MPTSQGARAVCARHGWADELLKSESAAYHGAGTCTFYGTANSNQMLLRPWGLHTPAAPSCTPHAELRDA